jgi:hypothetical protein
MTELYTLYAIKGRDQRIKMTKQWDPKTKFGGGAHSGRGRIIRAEDTKVGTVCDVRQKKRI